MSFYTSEEQAYELFSMCGEVKRIIMGLDRLKKTPCGFCFVEYPPLLLCNPRHLQRIENVISKVSWIKCSQTAFRSAVYRSLVPHFNGSSSAESAKCMNYGTVRSLCATQVSILPYRSIVNLATLLL